MWEGRCSNNSFGVKEIHNILQYFVQNNSFVEEEIQQLLRD